MDNATEQIADGVWRIEVALYVNAYVLANDGVGDREGLTLVDAGWRRSAPRLVRSLRLLGLDPRAVGDILLSHWHADHAGGAARFAHSRAASSVHAGRDDLAAVRGHDARPGRQAPAGARSTLGKLLGPLYRPAGAIPGAVALHHGQEFEVAGGLRVIEAPGHTPGHCAFLLGERGVLIAGDAIWNIWWLRPSPKFNCSQLPALPGTLHRLADQQFGVLAVGHGPPVSRDARSRVEALADRASVGRSQST